MPLPEHLLMLEVLSQRMESGLGLSADQLHRTFSSVESGNIKLLESTTEIGRYIGYIAYGYFDAPTLRLLSRTGQLPKNRHEWNEGRIMFVHDVVIQARWRDEGIRQLRHFVSDTRALAHKRRSTLMLYSCGRRKRAHHLRA